MTKFVFTVVGLLALSGVFWACQSGDEAVKETENEVFAVHDEVMPKIDDLFRLRKQLNQRIVVLDSLKKTSSGTAVLRIDEERQQAALLSRNLTVADSLMSNWMGQYKNDTIAELSPDNAMRYLSEQKDQITDVKAKVNTSIEQARTFLGKK
jgi:hypothetical protein